MSRSPFGTSVSPSSRLMSVPWPGLTRCVLCQGATVPWRLAHMPGLPWRRDLGQGLFEWARPVPENYVLVHVLLYCFMYRTFVARYLVQQPSTLISSRSAQLIGLADWLF